MRELAAGEHVGPFGDRVVVGRSTLDRWVRAWRAGGFDALVPDARRVQPRTQAQVLELAAALKRERPERTAAQVRRVVVAHLGWAPSERTLQAPYCAAAHGVAAFSEALRLELRHDQVPVHIVEVLPSPTNTPVVVAYLQHVVRQMGQPWPRSITRGPPSRLYSTRRRVVACTAR